jgi:putative transposase
MKTGTQLAVRRMCALTGVSRAGFYRRGGGSGSASVELRDRVQRVALEWPTYGSRRITAELRRCGVLINRKRVQRLMREDNLLCFRKRKFVATTDSAHGLRVYPNLAAALVVSGVNQLWRADITYIRLLEEFVFLAVVLDAFSRRAIGWALDGTMEAKLAVAALEMALERRRPAPGLVHHSDQGVQYASHDYVVLLETHEVQISMSRRGNPWDNATCESFMKTLKCEEVYRSEYRNLAEARARIGEFLEEIYNQKRLHSSLGYCPPAEFERLQSSRPMLVAAVAQEAR